LELLASNVLNVGGVEYNIHYKQNERKWLTMANLYTIENLLVGKTYNSKTLRGEIISAEKHPKGLWYGDNTEAYLVEINAGTFRNKFRTIAVKVGE
jgi:hypothetical protein